MDCLKSTYFYPRSPCGERPGAPCIMAYWPHFYPRSPCGERRQRSVVLGACVRHFYPRSPCGERPHPIGILVTVIVISIHALLAESDAVNIQRPTAKNDFYPRSPCGERPAAMLLTFLSFKFLSTLSLRRATVKSFMRNGFFLISIHALLAESDDALDTEQQTRAISIHALLAESDRRGLLANTSPGPFLSTLSLRRATDHQGDARRSQGDFYPRSPCGERLLSLSIV